MALAKASLTNSDDDFLSCFSCFFVGSSFSPKYS